MDADQQDSHLRSTSGYLQAINGRIAKWMLINRILISNPPWTTYILSMREQQEVDSLAVLYISLLEHLQAMDGKHEIQTHG